MSNPALFQRFFAELGASPGPFALLGLAPADYTDAAIDAALKSQLARLDAHPLSSTHDAGEVRQALYAAAAQLRSPEVRAHLIADDAILRGTRSSPTSGPSAAPAPRDAASSDLDERVREAIMLGGGWNPRTRARVAFLARQAGLSPADLQRRIVTSLASPTPALATAVAMPAAPGGAGRAPIASIGPARSRRRAGSARPARASSLSWVRAGILLTILLATFVMGRVLVVLRSRELAQRQAATQIAAQEAPPEQPPESEVSPSPAADVAALPVVAPRVRSASTAPVSPALAAPAPTPAAPTAPAPIASRSDIAQWAIAARAALSSPRPTVAAEALRAAERLAWLSTAGCAAWVGADTRDAISRSQRPLDAEPADASAAPAPASAPPPLDIATLTGPGAAGDGQLALTIIAIRRQPGAALEALARRRFAHEPPLGPVDCDAVAEAALYGSPAELRTVARRIALDQRTNPAMLNALLEAFGRAPRQPPVSELIEQVTGATLPRPADPHWAVRARAALVSALAEALGEVRVPVIDQIEADFASAAIEEARLLNSTGSPRAGSPGASDAVPRPALSPSATATPEAAQGELWRLWTAQLPQGPGRDDASRQNRDLPRLASKRATRLHLAEGPLQRFVAQRMSVVDVMALVLHSERSSAAEQIDAVTDQARARHREARDVPAQILVWEEAALRLWLIRLGDSSSSEPAG